MWEVITGPIQSNATIWYDILWYSIQFKSKAGCLFESQFAIIFADTAANPNPNVAKQDGAQLEVTQNMQKWLQWLCLARKSWLSKAFMSNHSYSLNKLMLGIRMKICAKYCWICFSRKLFWCSLFYFSTVRISRLTRNKSSVLILSVHTYADCAV